MKKVLFALAITGAFTMTSCKKGADAVEGAADATTEAAGTVVEAGADAANATVDAGANAVSSVADAAKGLLGADFAVPEFANAELGAWATSLVTAGTEAKTAATEGNQEGLKGAISKFTTLGTDLQNFKNDPDFSKAMDLYNKVKAILESL